MLDREGCKKMQSLSEETQADYARVKTALTERFELATKRELHNAELQVQTN